MAISLPAWPTDRIRRRERGSREADGRPLLLVMQDRQRQVVAACCDRASGAGVRGGMPLAQARALFSSAAVRAEPWDSAGDAAGLRRLALWAQRLSPVVAVDEPGGLMLDVTGCERVWGGEERLVEAAVGGLARLGVRARAAIAPTFGCAWAMARFGEGAGRIVGPGGVREALSPLPVAALRVGAEAVTQLAEVGVRRVGELLALPRSAIPARFGEGVLLRLDQALGQAMETIEPVRPLPPPAVERVFDGPTARVEAIEGAVRGLLTPLVGELARRGCGARRLDVELVRSDLGPVRLSVTLGRPSRDVRHLWQILRPKLEGMHMGFGVEAVRMEAAVVGRIRHEQAACVGGAGEVRDAEAERAWGDLLDTLRNRLGEGRVRRAALRESHVPERAFEMRDACGLGAGMWAGLGDAGCAPNDRPPVLLDRPSPAEVLALTPDGPVHRVAWSGGTHDVTACVGPERIGGEWWRTHPARGDRTRDYFSVRDERGRWLWVGRGVESGRWFVHGVWA